MKKKVKLSRRSVDILLSDLIVVTSLVNRQQQQLDKLSARVAVLEADRGVLMINPVPKAVKEAWWQNPIVSFQGKDAGEQAGL